MRLVDIRHRITAALRSIADRVEPPAPPPVGTPVRVGDLRVGDVFRTTTHRPGEWSRVVRLESWTEAKEHGGRTWVNVFTERGCVSTIGDRIVYRRSP